MPWFRLLIASSRASHLKFVAEKVALEWAYWFPLSIIIRPTLHTHLSFIRRLGNGPITECSAGDEVSHSPKEKNNITLFYHQYVVHDHNVSYVFLSEIRISLPKTELRDKTHVQNPLSKRSVYLLQTSYTIFRIDTLHCTCYRHIAQYFL